LKKQPKYSPEVFERALRMVSEVSSQYESQWAAITSIAAKIGCTPETPRRWVRQQSALKMRRYGQRLSGVNGVAAGNAANLKAVCFAIWTIAHGGL
jgi:transposase-like protein